MCVKVTASHRWDVFETRCMSVTLLAVTRVNAVSTGIDRCGTGGHVPNIWMADTITSVVSSPNI